MGDHPHTARPWDDKQTLDVDRVPDEEHLSEASAAEDVEKTAEEKANRPDQPDFDPEEKRQYTEPRVERAGPDESVVPPDLAERDQRSRER